jgi:hypothetical protein
MDAEKIKLNPQFLTDDAGNRRAVVLDLGEFRVLIELLEDYLDLKELEQAMAEETSFRPLEDVLTELKLEVPK